MRTMRDFSRPIEMAMKVDGGPRNFGNSGGIEFRTRTQSEDDSGISSPPLWKMSPPRNPAAKAPHFQHHYHHRYDSPSPSPRSQVIADGRRELMEMIKDASESAYELSLKDIVELQASRVARANLAEETEGRKATPPTTMRSRSNGHERRNRNVNRGAFLLKMFFPVSLAAKKRPSGASMSSKVSPKPPAEGEKVGLEEGVEREQWKKQKSGGRDGEIDEQSRSSESGNRSNSPRQIDGVIPRCWSFLIRNNNKKAKALKQ
ncbi:hypothetical protein ACLOJK_016793 [Asimina triloba]